MTNLPSTREETSSRSEASSLTAEINNLATMLGVKDKERIELVAKTIFGAAHEEKIGLQFVAQAVKDYTLGKVEGYNSAFFPTPADLIRRARYCRDNRTDDPDRYSHHDRPVQYPPGIREQVERIQKKMASAEYLEAKRAHVMRLRLEGKLPRHEEHS